MTKKLVTVQFEADVYVDATRGKDVFDLELENNLETGIWVATEEGIEHLYYQNVDTKLPWNVVKVEDVVK